MNRDTLWCRKDRIKKEEGHGMKAYQKDIGANMEKLPRAETGTF